MKHRNLLEAVYLVFFLIAPGVLFAQNPNCTIIVPDAPLTAAGLATPYQLTATTPADGECHEGNANFFGICSGGDLRSSHGTDFDLQPVGDRPELRARGGAGGSDASGQCDRGALVWI